MHEVIIIGAGQAGLATAYHLKQLGISALLLDENLRIGDVWRKRWDSLCLFSPAKYSNLPGLKFELPDLALPTKNQVAEYFEAYAQKFKLEAKLGTKVLALRKEADIFVLETNQAELKAKAIVVATGAFHTPKIPAFADSAAADILQIHVSNYQNPSDLQEGPVLVVGTGASGTQIAAEISKSRKVYLSGPDTPNMPRQKWGKDIYWWLYTTGMMNLKAEGWLGKRLLKTKTGGDALIGASLAEIVAKNGLIRKGMLLGLEAEKAVFENEAPLSDIRNIVWATGFKNDYSWVKMPVFDAEGLPLQKRGKAKAQTGLYFMGIKFMYRADSSNLGGVGRDAKWIASDIQGFLRK